MKKFVSLMVMACLVVSVYAWKPVFAGHRGSLRGVSNTAEAYRNGVDVYGYTGLECDVRVTSDGEYVILHDETTASLGGNLTVTSSTLAQLKAETLTQTRSSVTYTGTICTVSEYLDICNEKNAFPLIELKWTTGINNSDMSKFAGLLALVESKGLKNKVIFLTSMKSSIEYIRTNYPTVTCQFLTGEYWANHFDWCVQWQVNPSIQAGYFDIQTTKKFHDVGLQVAVWTVNDQANYKKYGDMGVYMMTCDYLPALTAADLADIDWAAIPGNVDPLKVVTKTLWRKCAADNTLPADFPIGSGTYGSAQQAACYDSTFYVNDYTSKKLLTITKEGLVGNSYTGTSSHGVAVDDAGNLILRNDGYVSTTVPSKLVLYKKGETTGHDLNFGLKHVAQANFIFATGDVFSEEGGYVYMYPNTFKYVDALKIVNGAIVDTITSGELSTAASTAGMVYPVGNDPTNFLYQVRNVGFYRYKAGINKGDYLTGSSTTTAPARNSSLGGAFFILDGHEILVHASGANYNGGLSVKDMSANGANLATFTPLGSAAYAGNPSTGCFVKAEQVNEYTYNIYEYCMGNGIAAYQITLNTSTSINQAKKAGVSTLYPVQTDNIATVESYEPISSVRVYNMTGTKMLHMGDANGYRIQIDLSRFTPGMYYVRVNNQPALRVMKK